MSRTALKLTLLMVLVFLWDLLFWDQLPGLNLFLFVIFIIAAIISQRPSSFKSPATLAFAIMSLITASMVVIHNSGLSVFVLSLLIFCFVGFSLVPEIRSTWYAGLTVVINYGKMPFVAYSNLSERILGAKRGAAFLRTTKLAVIPIMVTLVFYFIYKGANPRFDSLTANVFGSFFEFIGDLLSDLFTARGFFILFGILLIAGVIYRFNPLEALRMEDKHKDELEGGNDLSAKGLPNEYRSGVIMLTMVNAVLLVVNIIDIDWIWFGFEVPEGFSLKQFVHEGTWLLILSIVLSMVIVFYLFRSQQNFFKPEGWLHRLSYLWIAQNLVLGFSVFLRNYQYISFHGLAYKRIGMILFLFLVLIGLATMFLKVKNRRTLFYLVRFNSFAAAGSLCLMTMVNWDSVIVRYNLEHSNPAEIDVDNYLKLSSKVLPQLYADLDRVERQIIKHGDNEVQWISINDPNEFKRHLDARKVRFLKKHQKSSWQSWSLADQNTYDALLSIGQVPAEYVKE